LPISIISNADFTLTVANTATQYSAIVTNNSKFEVVDPNTIKKKGEKEGLICKLIRLQ